MGAFISGIALTEGKMMKILFILVVLTCLALGEDFSAEDKAEVAVASGEDLLHHSLAKRDAGKTRKRKGEKKRGKRSMVVKGRDQSKGRKQRKVVVVKEREKGESQRKEEQDEKEEREEKEEKE